MSAVTPLGTLTIAGTLADDDLSAVDVVGDFAVIASDETNLVQVAERVGGGYVVRHDLKLHPDDDVELDLEGLAHDGTTVYAVGSHSARQKKVDPTAAESAARTRDKNRKRLEVVEPTPERDGLFRFTLAADGTPTFEGRTTLRPFLEHATLFDRFRGLPGKENGIDIEGLAFHGGELYVGFRGPVLRAGWAVVLRCPFKTPEVKKDDGELLFVNLDGYGVRDLARGANAFLILAGPAGELPSTFRLYSWDGQDCLPGTRAGGTRGTVTLLGDVPDATDPVTGKAGKPEGISVLGESADAYELLMVYDSISGGRPTRLRVSKS